MSGHVESTRSLDLAQTLTLESGFHLPSVTVAYRTWGRLNERGDNAVLVCHALTGSADADRWWDALIGPGRALDTDQDFIICSNVLGSCYGTTGPISARPDAKGRWGGDFPVITVRDIVRVQAALLEALGVQRLRLVIGGSLGGMQVLEWALLFPDRVEAIAPLAISARHSAWCIGLSETQRQAIYADPRWRNGYYPADDAPEAGLAVARQIAMCTYRSWASLESRFSRTGRPRRAVSPSRPGCAITAAHSLTASMPVPTLRSRKPWTPTTWAGDEVAGKRRLPRLRCLRL